MGLPVTLTWMLGSREVSLPPIIGQFKAESEWKIGDHLWTQKPGILGSEPWVKYLGRNHDSMTFRFHYIADNILDQIPILMMELLTKYRNYNS